MNKITYLPTTRIPNEILHIDYKDGKLINSGMLFEFCRLGYIDNKQNVTCEFMNKYHFEIYLEEYLKCKNDDDIIKLANKIFKGGKNEDN